MMKKKILGVLIFSLLICTLFSITVFADCVISEDGKSVSGSGIAFDDFEGTGLKESTQVKDYPANTGGASAYFSEAIQPHGANNAPVHIAVGEGLNGSTALEVRSSNNFEPQITTRYIADFVGNNKIAVVTYAMKIASNPQESYDYTTKPFSISVGYFNNAGNQLIFLERDADGKYYFTDYEKKNKFYYEVGKWYNYELSQSATERCAYILDAEGNVLMSAKRTAAPFDSASKQFFTLISLRGGAASSFKAYIDDVKINMYTAEDAASLANSSIENGAENVERNKPLLLSFDKKINSATIKVRDENGTEFTGVKVLDAGSFGNKIIFTSLLDKKKTYTIDFATAQTVLGGSVTAENISFTTKNAYILGTKVTSTEMSADKKTLTASYIFSDNESIEKMSARLMATVYDGGKMFDASFIELSDVPTNTEQSAVFTFAKEIPQNALVHITAFEKGAFLPLSKSVIAE